MPQVANRLEVGCQAAGRSHQSDIAPRLALAATARLNPVEIAAKRDLGHRRGMPAVALFNETPGRKSFPKPR